MESDNQTQWNKVPEALQLRFVGVLELMSYVSTNWRHPNTTATLSDTIDWALRQSHIDELTKN
jgi:hypothetical protein